MLRSETTDDRSTNLCYLPNRPLAPADSDSRDQTSILVYCIVVLSFTVGWLSATRAQPNTDNSGKHFTSNGRYGHVTQLHR